MKTTLTFIIGLMLALPGVASAASFSVTPTTGSYAVGDTIALSVAVTPAGSTVYTAMLNASFSSEVFEVVSFSMNDSMLPLKMAGYDTVDNASGVLVKTGGYTGGTSSDTSFGTIVLRAKKVGTGSLAVNATSKLLDANDSNQMLGAQVVSFTITAAESSLGGGAHDLEQIKETKYQKSEIKGEESETVSTSTTATSTASQLLAAVAEVVATTSVVTWILGLLVLVLGIALFVNKRAEKGE